ncbi:MAG: hypothetical protein ABI178_00335 [Rhodanobacter sp.]
MTPLLTHDNLRGRRRHLNSRATLSELPACNVIPVVSENDTVAVDEPGLGDNDTLAAIITRLNDADMLLIATDIDGLYTADAHSGDIGEIVGESPDGEPHVVARGITRHGAAEINQRARSYTRDIRQRLGYSYGESIVYRDDLVITTDSGVTS